MDQASVPEVAGRGPVIRLPLDGDEPEDWLYAVVLGSTGVLYSQQYGGYHCNQVTVEGFLVPLCDVDALHKLRYIFIDELLGYSFHGTERSEELVRRIGEIVAAIAYPRDNFESLYLKLDRTRLSELHEAWVPVTTPDGPGYLAWVNSD